MNKIFTKFGCYIIIFMLALGIGLVIDNFEGGYSRTHAGEKITYEQPVLQVADGASDGKVNINTASKEELTKLNGIGDKLATKIINYRSENGRFEVIQDIMNVTGIGHSQFKRIESDITTGF